MYFVRSIDANRVTAANIVNAVATYENLAPDNFDANINDGYPICIWQMSSKAKQKYDADNFEGFENIIYDNLPNEIGRFSTPVTWKDDSGVVAENGKISFSEAERTVTVTAITEDGYETKEIVITILGKVPFSDYTFNVTKDGESYTNFVSGGVIDKVSYYKNRACDDCYMFTVLYDRLDGNRMLGCSMDYIDASSQLPGNIQTVNLSVPFILNSQNTSRYLMKIIFLKNLLDVTPICDNYEYKQASVNKYEEYLFNTPGVQEAIYLWNEVGITFN